LQYHAIASPALDSIAHPPRLLFTGQLYSRNQMQEITDHAWSNKTHQWTGYANGTKSHAADGSTNTYIYQRPALRLAEMRHYFRGCSRRIEQGLHENHISRKGPAGLEA
jgi:hypothetical protein